MFSIIEIKINVNYNKCQSFLEFVLTMTIHILITYNSTETTINGIFANF